MATHPVGHDWLVGEGRQRERGHLEDNLEKRTGACEESEFHIKFFGQQVSRTYKQAGAELCQDQY